MQKSEEILFNRALRIAQFVVIYNIIEGIVSMITGYADESLTLFGFGADSFIEVASNLGVIFMINRIKQNPESDRTNFEKTALKITGYSFYVLSIGLSLGAVLSIIEKHKPINTMLGVFISLLSILVMWYVAHKQLKTGKALNSQPIISDARCTIVCIYMSVVLLASSLIYYLTGFRYVDALGAIGLAWFSVKEGKEAIEKSKGRECCDDC
ncbi:MAG: cation transporter [Daejeonella sp.]